MTLTRDQELWAIALWVEKTHGERGSAFIAEKIDRFSLNGEAGGAGLWREVAVRYDRLMASRSGTTPS